MDEEHSLSTIHTYGQVLASFTTWMAQNHPAVTAISQLKLNQLQQFRRYLRERSAAYGRELSPRTQAKYLATIRSLLRYYTTVQGELVLPPEQIRLPRVGREDDRPRRPLSRGDLQRLLEQPDVSKPWGLRDRAIIALLINSGLRVSELCSLNRSDVREDLLGQHPFLEVTVSPHARRIRSIYLDAFTQEQLAAYLAVRQDRYPPLFVRHKPGKGKENDDPQHRLTRQMVARMLNKYAREAGLTTLPSAQQLRRARFSPGP